MHVALRCPCGANLKAPVKYVGRELKCPKCSKMLVVPEPPMAQTSQPEMEVLEPYEMPAAQAPVMPVATSPVQPANVARKAVAPKSKSKTRWPILVAVGGVLFAIFGGVLWYVYSSTSPEYKHKLELGGGISALDDLPDAPEEPVTRGESIVANPHDSKVADLASVEDDAESLPLTKLITLVDPSIVRITVVEYGGDEKIGSGFFLDTEGKIATNNHVIERAAKVTVSTVDGKKAEAVGLVITEPRRDLAIIQVNPEDFDCVPIKIARDLPVKGEDIVAFGAPAGFSFSQTEGTVSSVRSGKEVRDILNEMAPGRNIYESKRFEDDIRWIQHSASISGGNSGGPLVNMRGEMVGVNTWTHQQGQNLNFASTMDQVQKVFENREKGEMRPFEGAMIETQGRPNTNRGSGRD